MTKDPHLWREDFRCYASQWGFRCGSGVAKLIEYVREEERWKYGSDYRLARVGKNKFVVMECKSRYCLDFIVESAKKFGVKVS